MVSINIYWMSVYIILWKEKFIPSSNAIVIHEDFYLFSFVCLTKCHVQRNTVQFSSVAQSCLTLCDPMNHSTPGLPVHHQLLEFTQTHSHWVGDAIQPYKGYLNQWSSSPDINLALILQVNYLSFENHMKSTLFFLHYPITVIERRSLCIFSRNLQWTMR